MSKKILIIDDDVETVRLISLVLRKQGYDIVTATNGEEGIGLAQQVCPVLIILDIMMPDMDGYQATHQLRQNPVTANIPILMFSAKSHVNDRVTGYEAGIDDYVVKPVHPAELIARVKTLISRNKTQEGENASKGYTIAVLSPKGGLGSSTMALNLGIVIHELSQKSIIVAELHPGHGYWASELDIGISNGYVSLLQKKPSEINLSAIQKALVQSPLGIKLLLSSNSLADVPLINAGEQIESVVRQLPFISSIVILDIGANYLPNFNQIAGQCQEIILLTEPYMKSVERTRGLMNDLVELGFGKTKPLTLANINRIRAEMQVPYAKIQEILGKEVYNFPTASEMVYQASMSRKPLVLQQKESLLIQQYHHLAYALLKRIPA